jgi:hypothetical protein
VDWDKYVEQDEADGNDIDETALAGGNDMGGKPYTHISHIP